MRPLTTPVEFNPPFDLQSLPRRIASIGSCFSEKITGFLDCAGFECRSNPNGIVYNPFSVLRSVRHITEDLPYGETDLFEFDGKFHSREHHGRFSSADPAAALAGMEAERKGFREFLQQPCPVILTFGTAVVFREKSSGRIVANCHKVPGTEFSREILSAADCSGMIAETVGMIRQSGEHPVILSVSPVRHHPGDPVLNSRSKAVLLGSCHEAAERFPGKCVYFPAFEYLNDELRDYRFYADDLIHPSAPAEEFIIENFVRKFYPDSAEEILSRARKTIKANNHITGGK